MKERKKRGIIRWLALLTPLLQLALFIWVFFLYRIQALHPSHWPFTILVLLIVAGIFAQFVVFAGALWTTQERVQQLRWLTLVLLPALAAVWGGLYVHRITSDRYIPDNLLLRWMASAGVSLADLELAIRYPVVVEGRRVRMFCHEEQADGPELVRQMDEHIEAMERQLGRTGQTKAHWVRGHVLGRTDYQFFGLAMSDYEFLRDSQEVKILPVDRHELAHFALSQFVDAQSSVPFVLIEGWAQAMSNTSEQLAVDAWRARYREKSIWKLEYLTTSPWYRYDRGPVYSIGGAFVDYLVRHYGAPSFMKLYIMAREDQFADQFKEVYKQSLAEVETKFWDEVEGLVPEADRGTGTGIDPKAYTQDVGKDLWLELVSAINARTQAVGDEEDRLHVQCETLRENNNQSTVVRSVEDYWRSGTDVWLKNVGYSEASEIVGEEAMFTGKDHAFAVDWDKEADRWRSHSDFDISAPLTRADWIAGRIDQSKNYYVMDIVATRMLGLHSSHRSEVIGVQETVHHDGRNLIEVRLKQRTDVPGQWSSAVLLIDPNLDYQVVESTYQYVPNSEQFKADSATYRWSREKGQLRLVESVANREAVHGPSQKITKTWKYEAMKSDAQPPFREADFSVTNSWREMIPELTVENSFQIATYVDLAVLGVCCAAGLRRRPTR